MSRKFYWVTITKSYLSAFALLIIVLFLLSLPSSYQLGVLTATLVSTSVEYDIVLDAGHGGIDSGGIGAGDVYEKDLVLDIVLRMRDILEGAGLKVGLTRDTDMDVTHLAKSKGTRHQRDLEGRFIALHSGKIGMSVHANTSKSSAEQGAIVFYRRNSYIGKQYATSVLEAIEQVQVLNHDYPVPRSNLMLIKAKPPVVLVEVGFLTNPDDLAKLTDPDFRQSIAEALCKGIANFYAVYRSEQSE
ncbi:MAG: N-acetylmuramoyl-L-alanine amidase [Firmicutes bacterium]|nr:N-acetylmuramoyl-L-alanine amidase [Bacillota bacterium]